MAKSVFVGCAGWNIRSELAQKFASGDSHLQRYSQRFRCVEINSSFYRPHRLATYQRWATETPPSFRFAVKIPKQVTHLKRLVNAHLEIQQFADQTAGLGDKLGVVLVQLPPNLSFEPEAADSFFRSLQAAVTCAVVCEPRHLSWFSPEAESLLASLRVGRVAADPAINQSAAVPGGCLAHIYFRWHGSPRKYYSAYEELAMQTLALRLLDAARHAKTAWCIFDNTAEGAAITNALELMALLERASV